MTEEPLPPELEIRDSLPDGLKVTTARPYRILLVGDLGGTEAGSVSGPLCERVVPTNADEFDDLMVSARPTVRFKTADPLLPGNVLTEVELTFETLKAFQPKAVAQQFPLTRMLLEAREALVGRLRGKLSAAQLAGRVEQLATQPTLAWLPEAIRWTPSTAAPPPEDMVDNLLGSLDLGDGAPAQPPRKTPIGAVVAAAAGGGATLPAEESMALRRGLAEIDRRVGVWLTTLLHAPAVQRLEAAWRGLAFLITQMDFRKHLQLSVLHAPRGALTERLVTLLIDPVFDAGAEAPDLIVVDAQFTNSARDIETLDELAQHAGSLPAVLLSGVSAEFLGVKNAWQVPTLPSIVSLFDQWQFAKWKTLRGQPYARHLGLVFGRCLLRAPWAPADGDELEFRYREECLAESDFVWTSGAIAAACTIARSVAETGWPTGMVGRLGGFAIGLGGKKGDKQYGPADTQLLLDKAQELAVGGLNAVIGIRDQADVLVCNGFTAARPARGDTAALLEVSLPYRLFAGRLSSLLLDLKPYLVGMPQEKLVAFVLAHVRDWMTMEDVPPDEQQISVQARPAEDAPQVLELAVTVTPPPRLLPGGIPVVMGYRVG